MGIMGKPWQKNLVKAGYDGRRRQLARPAVRSSLPARDRGRNNAALPPGPTSSSQWFQLPDVKEALFGKRAAERSGPAASFWTALHHPRRVPRNQRGTGKRAS
jgi:hypothetical protein